jgi:hypothetical protein
MHTDATIHHDLIQGNDEWLAARNGLLTASEVKLILTPTLKVANNEKTRAHVYEIAAQRITGYTEPTYIGDDMLRGYVDEVKARDLYSEHIAPVEEVGFITRDVSDGCVIGYSPDGMDIMGEFGIECKSRRQKFQVQVVTGNAIPDEHILQVQTGLLVTGWDYIDYISYCGGLPMWVIRSEPIPEYQDAILTAADAFEKQVAEKLEEFGNRLASATVVIETEREIEQEMVI